MLRKVLATILATISFNYLFFRDGLTSTHLMVPLFGTLGFMLFIVMANLLIFLTLSKDLNSKKESLAIKSTLVALVLALLSFIRADFVDRFLLSFASIGFTLISTYLLALTHNDFGSLIETFLVPFKLFGGWLGSIAELIQKPRTERLTIYVNKQRPTIKPIVAGLVVTIPVIVVLVLLLSGADPIFSDIVKDLFTFTTPKIPEWIAVRGFSTLLFLIIVVPIFYLKITDRFKTPLESEKFSGLTIPALILTTSVSLVLGSFILVQFQYLFTQLPETELIKHGVQTYSEYVKKGFFELGLVSMIVYFVSGVVIQTIKSDSGSKVLKALNLFLIFEALVFMISILRRVYLYQHFHGFTSSRIYGILFLTYVIFMTLMLLIRQIKVNLKNYYIYEIGFLAMVFIAIGFINISKLVSITTPPTVNGEVDYVYISSLSADAIDSWPAVYNHAKGEIESLSKVNAQRDFNEEEARRFIYAYHELQNLHNNFYFLTGGYGKSADTLFKTLGVTTEGNNSKSLNLGEKFAYDRLNNGLIDMVEYSSILATSRELENKYQYQTRRRIKLDRPIRRSSY